MITTFIRRILFLQIIILGIRRQCDYVQHVRMVTCWGKTSLIVNFTYNSLFKTVAYFFCVSCWTVVLFFYEFCLHPLKISTLLCRRAFLQNIFIVIIINNYNYYFNMYNFAVIVTKLIDRQFCWIIFRYTLPFAIR